MDENSQPGQSFLGQVTENIKDISEKTSEKEIPEKEKETILKIESLLREIDDIYANCTRYDLHWAFENAQQKFNDIFLDILDNHIRPSVNILKARFRNCELEAEIKSDISKITRMNSIRKRHIRRNSELFTIASDFVSIVDIIISVILIVFISKLSFFVESGISSAYLGVMFIGFIALLKVTLDRFYIIPHVRKGGWQLYKKAADRFRTNLSVLLAVSIVVNEFINEERDSMEILAVFRRGLKKFIN